MSRKHIIIIIISVAVLGPFFVVFWPVLFGSRSFRYGDSAFTFYPLFEWIAREWSSGRIPVWNPYHNCGTPVLAEANSIVLYPLKLVFALPLAYVTRYNLFVTAHVLLAAGAAFKLARHWRVSTTAAAVCAISYAYSGTVLFFYSNVLFLIGAAWLPLALLAACHMLEKRSIPWALTFGAILALMVLGGDPQTGYNAGLAATGYAWLRWRARRRAQPSAADAPSTASPDTSRLSRLRRHGLTLLAIAAVSGGLMAAVQILPSAEWKAFADRDYYSVPRSIYEIPSFLARDSLDAGSMPGLEGVERQPDAPGRWGGIRRGLFGTPAGGHHSNIYSYSVSPWRGGELIWPNLSGRRFSGRRFREWSPSLYMGLLPILLALGSLRLWGRASPHVRWLSWLVLLAALGSLGHYGLGWLINGAGHVLMGQELGPGGVLGWPTGGLYWFMVVALPGYVTFRFPAKLLVFAALGLSLLAAFGWDRTVGGPAKGFRRVLAVLGILSLIALLLVTAIGARWDEAKLFLGVAGPLDELGTAREITIALLHTAVVCGVMWYLLRQLGRNRRKWLEYLVLILVSAEITVANGWMVPDCPAEIWSSESPVTRITAEHDAGTGQEPYRIFRVFALRPRGDFAKAFGLRTYHDTACSRHHLLSDIALVERYGGSNYYAFLSLMKVAREFGPPRTDWWSAPSRSVLNVLGGKYLILEEQPVLTGLEAIESASAGLPSVASMWKNPEFFPRSWIVHEVDWLPPFSTTDMDLVDARTRFVFFPGGKPRDLRVAAIVEADRPLSGESTTGAATHPEPSSTQREWSRTVSADPQRVEIEAFLTTPGLLVLSDTFYPGWIAQVTSAGQAQPTEYPVFRTNRIMRGIFLPAGHHRVVYHYRASKLYVGAAISTIAWGAFILCTIIAYLRWRKRTRGDGDSGHKITAGQAGSSTTG